MTLLAFAGAWLLTLAGGLIVLGGLGALTNVRLPAGPDADTPCLQFCYRCGAGTLLLLSGCCSYCSHWPGLSLHLICLINACECGLRHACAGLGAVPTVWPLPPCMDGLVRTGNPGLGGCVHVGSVEVERVPLHVCHVPCMPAVRLRCFLCPPFAGGRANRHWRLPCTLPICRQLWAIPMRPYPERAHQQHLTVPVN